MARRSRAREVILQLLYQQDQNPQLDQATVQRFLQGRLRDETLEGFGRKLFDGVIEHRAAIDARLAAVAENWSVERMAAVDRNVLRLGAYELLFDPETPAKVVIDESIELAKRFGAAESPAFVNGILDKLAAERDKPSAPAAT